MIELALTPKEALLLEQVLGRCVSDLEFEILHTDNAGFRKMLKERRSALAALHERLTLVDRPHPAAVPLM